MAASTELNIRLQIDANGNIAVQQLGNVRGAVQGLDQSFGDLRTKLLAAGASAFAIDRLVTALHSVADTGDLWQSLAAQIGAANTQLADNDARLAEIAEVARLAGRELDATATLYASLERASDLNNKSLEEAAAVSEENLAITKALGDALLINGTKTEAANGALRQLAQSLESGTLRGDEFNSVAEQMPALLTALSRELNIGRDELREFAATGGISADIVRRAVLNISSDWAAAAAEMPNTLDRTLTNLETRWTEYIGHSQGVANATEALNNFLGGIGENLEAIAEVAGEGALLLISAALVAGAKAAAGYVAGLQASAAASVNAASAALTQARAQQQAALVTQQSRLTRANQTAATLAQAEAELVAARAATTGAAQVVAAEQAATAARTAHATAMGRLTAAQAAYATASTRAATASTALSTAAAGTAGALGTAMAAMRSMGAGLIQVLPFAALAAELDYLIQGIDRLVDQYKEFGRIAEIEEEIAEQARKTGDVVINNLRRLEQYAGTAIEAEAALAEMSREQGDAYLDRLTRAARYWAAVAVAQKQAGDLTAAAGANERVEALNAAYDAQAPILERLIAAQGQLTPVAQGLLEKFDGLAANGKGATEALRGMLEGLKFDPANAIVNVGALAEAIARLGTANAETGEAVRATAAEIRDGLSPVLAKLAGGDLANFAREWVNVTAALTDTPIPQVAVVLDTVLGAALAKLKLNLEELRTGISVAGADMLGAFEAVALTAQGDMAVVAAAWDTLLAALKNSEEIDAARAQLQRLGAEGKVGVDLVTAGLRQLDLAAARVAATTGAVADAFKRLGVTSQAELRAIAAQAQADFEIIRDSGTATPADIASAWEAYAEKAIASGDTVAQNTARQEAAALGLIEKYRELAGETAKVAEATDAAADAAKRQQQAVAKTAAAVKQAAQEQSFGIDFEQVFAEGGLKFGPAVEPGFKAALTNAYNRWLREQAGTTVPLQPGSPGFAAQQLQAAGTPQATTARPTAIIRFEFPGRAAIDGVFAAADASLLTRLTNQANATAV